MVLVIALALTVSSKEKRITKNSFMNKAETNFKYNGISREKINQFFQLNQKVCQP
ncbi:hypothetical protein Klosneuvirus_3_261 [Klosneuvirus KNV1]|uniref:Uncharacterized protein n=1 Tax=Klosneuvirus KNV1 TaxID=1977640 RepID=A0A1V0SK82_9VIRU|nr:hypothetical protein Klosneuvirus_3_261 [Klosneuvirus KNV1]